MFQAQTANGTFGDALSNCYQKRPHDAPRPVEPAVILAADCYDAEEEHLTILSNGQEQTGQGLGFNRLDVFPNAEIFCRLRLPGSGSWNGKVEFVKMAAGNSNTGGPETPRAIDIYAGSSLSHTPSDWALVDTIYYETDVVDSVQTATAREMVLTTPVTANFIKLHIKDNHGGTQSHTTLRQIAFLGTKPTIVVDPVVPAR